MEIKPKHTWIVVITLLLVWLGALKIQSPGQSKAEWQRDYKMQLMLLNSDVHRAELLKNK